MTYEIRAGRPADCADWRGLWQGFLDHYDMSLAPQVTDFTWQRLMDPSSPMALRVADSQGQLLGFSIHQPHPSTWVMGDDCYLEDLYVAPAARGMGVGRALVEDLVALARARGWHRLHWFTDMENAAARRLYDSLATADGHIRYRRDLRG